MILPPSNRQVQQHFPGRMKQHRYPYFDDSEQAKDETKETGRGRNLTHRSPSSPRKSIESMQRHLAQFPLAQKLLQNYEEANLPY